MDQLAWKTETRRVNNLKGFDKNPRQITAKQRADLEASLEKFDLAEIPVIDQDDVIIAGNQRVEVLRSLGRGEEEIEVRVPSRPLTERERKEYNLRSNKNTGEWDSLTLFENFDKEMLLEVGFTMKEMGDMGGSFTDKDRNENDFQIPEMELKAFEHYDYIVFAFRTTQDWINVLQAFNVEKVDSSWVPGRKKIGLGRVIEGAELLRQLGLEAHNPEQGSSESNHDSQDPALCYPGSAGE